MGLVRGKYIPAGLHASEASCVSSSSLSAFRAAIVRTVWSSKMPLANTPAVLNLLDGLVGVDPALHIIWVWFRMMHRYLACNPDESQGFLGCWIKFLERLLAMAQCIFSSLLLLSLALPGIVVKGAGCVHVSLPLG